MTISELLEKKVRETPKKTYLFFEDQEITYEDFNNNANRIAHGLSQWGIKKGDKVCIYLTNRPEFLYFWFGVSKIGAILVPINTLLTGEELKYIVNHSEAKAILSASPQLDTLLGIRRECEFLKEVISISDKPIPDTTSFQEWIKDFPSTNPGIEVTETDLAAIMYTSGTTARPKGVMLTHFSYLASAKSFCEIARLTPEDRMFMILALFHINAQTYSTLASLMSGAQLVGVSKFSTSKYWDQVKQYGVTEIQLLLGPLAMLLNMPERKEEREHKVRLAVGAFTKEMYDAVKRRFNIPEICTGWSQTECPLCILISPDAEYKPRLIGRPRKEDNMEAKIVDEDGKEVPRGAMGELIIKCPAVMKGYYKNPEETAKTLRDGWLHTGDNCYQDENGDFYFVDRLKDTIRRADELIASTEVEGVLMSHPKIADAAVIPVPDKIRIEEVKAYIVLQEGESITPEEIIDHCAKKLAGFKIPRYIEFRESLPKTATGRTRKFMLKQEKDLTACWDRLAQASS